MRRALKQLALAISMILVVTLAGVVLSTGTASAGGVGDNGYFAAAVYNGTPYTWTLVAAQAPPKSPFQSPSSCSPNSSCWYDYPAATIAGGGGMVYRIMPNTAQSGGIFGGMRYGYDAWFTYRVDVVGAAAEYVTISVTQCKCSGYYGNSDPTLRQFFTTTPPASTYDPGGSPDTAPAPVIANPQLTFQVNVPYAYDLSYVITGNWTVDAATAPPSLVNVLNSFCAGTAGTTCTFTATEPMTWGIGAPKQQMFTGGCNSTSPPTGGRHRTPTPTGLRGPTPSRRVPA